MSDRLHKKFVADIEGRWKYSSSSRELEIEYTFEALRNGTCRLVTESTGKYTINNTSRNDYGVMIARATSSHRVVHEGTWRAKGTDAYFITLNEYFTDTDGTDKMTVNARLEDGRLHFLDWRAGLYGKRPEFRFERRGSADDWHDRRDRPNSGGSTGGGSTSGGRDEDEWRDGRIDRTFRTDTYFDRNRDNGVRYRLELRRDGRASLEIQRDGRVPLDRDSLRDWGRVLERLDRRSRITLTGTYRRTADNLEINFDRLDDGDRTETIRQRLTGDARRGSRITLDRFDEDFFGSRTRLDLD